MKIEKIENGLLGKNNSVFIAFYSNPEEHYKRHPVCEDWGHKAWSKKVALVGVMIRYNSVFGFVGGKVDPGEALIDAAHRECVEEVNYNVDKSSLSLFCSHKVNSTNKTQNIHLYKCKISPNELYKIRKLSCDAEYGEVECAAFSVIHLNEDAQDILLNGHKWAGSGVQEMDLLLKSIKL